MTAKTVEAVVTGPKKLAIAKRAPVSDNPMMALIERAAFDPSCDVSKLKELLAVKRELEKEEARKAFVRAMVEFKSNAPEILKSKEVNFETAKGRTNYRHATLAKASAIISAAAGKHGLAHDWTWEPSPEKGQMRVTCIVTHVMGHSKSVYMDGPDDLSGSKNPMQARGSGKSYLERYTLFAAYGLAAADDDDGAASSKRKAATKVDGPEDSPTARGIDSFPVGAKFLTKKGNVIFFNGGERPYRIAEDAAKNAKANFNEGDTATVNWTMRDNVYMVETLTRTAKVESGF
jgi:hypothetical protein